MAEKSAEEIIREQTVAAQKAKAKAFEEGGKVKKKAETAKALADRLTGDTGGLGLSKEEREKSDAEIEAAMKKAKPAEKKGSDPKMKTTGQK